MDIENIHAFLMSKLKIIVKYYCKFIISDFHKNSLKKKIKWDIIEMKKIAKNVVFQNQDFKIFS